MRKIFYIAICAAFALLSAACNRAENVEMGENEGVISLKVHIPGTRATEVDSSLPFVLKIYRYTDSTKSTKELVRKYTSLSDIPQYVWLVIGDYAVQATVGNKELASFTDTQYFNSKDFEITPGEITPVELVCDMVNIPVSVVYDDTVGEHFTEVYTYVYASNSANLEGAKDSSLPALKYTESKTGYFILPDGTTNLQWYFCGNDGSAEPITAQGVIENPTAENLYTLKFKYSPDAPGKLIITTASVVAPEYRPEEVPFIPDPTIKGYENDVEFDIDAAYEYKGGTRTYNIKALDNITTLTITYGDTVYDLINGTTEGITVERASNKEYNVSLSEPFFNTLLGGEQSFTLYVKDYSNGIARQECQYTVAGSLPLGDYELWFGTTTFYARSYSGDNLTIGYRTPGGEWKKTGALTATSTENIYTVTATTDLTAGKNFEVALFANDVQVGGARTVTTYAGNQIPEAGFEKWSTSGKAICPAADPNNLFWDSGNHAVASFTSTNLTVSSTEVHSGSTGTYSASLSSKYVVMKFAAGNLFVGRFVGTEETTHGIVEFGREFDFNARPKAIRFWMKHNQGTINRGDYTTGQDLAKIFCCLTDRKYTCRTAYPETLFIPSNDTEGVMATALWQSTESHTEWQQYEIPIEYKDGVTTKPTHLVITFTCSGYGDYFTGSEDSWMFVDDVEFVY